MNLPLDSCTPHVLTVAVMIQFLTLPSIDTHAFLRLYCYFLFFFNSRFLRSTYKNSSSQLVSSLSLSILTALLLSSFSSLNCSDPGVTGNAFVWRPFSHHHHHHHEHFDYSHISVNANAL